MRARWRRAAGAPARLAIMSRSPPIPSTISSWHTKSSMTAIDRTQLAAMGEKALEAMGQEEITALADRGYYKGEEVLALEGTGVLPCVPKTQTSNNPDRGLFSGDDFVYDAKADHYTCPAGEHLTKGAVRSDRQDNMDHYRNLTACLTCALKPQCTPDNKVKRVKRWQHEGVLDKMQERLDRMPDAMTIRRQTVEHAF